MQDPHPIPPRLRRALNAATVIAALAAATIPARMVFHMIAGGGS